MRTKRSEPRKADAILTADWHIRADVPVCRTDDYSKAQWRKVSFIRDLAKEQDCPILIAGDVGHRPHWPNWLLAEFIRHIQGDVRISVVPGQHDLPGHRLDKYNEGALGVLCRTKPGVAIHLDGVSDGHTPGIYIVAFPYGSIISRLSEFDKDYCAQNPLFPGIALAHQMVIEDKPLWPGQLADNAQTLLRKHPEFQLIVTGDNHLPFVAEREGRLLVNPGSMMRMTADQADHRPRVYLWYAETNTVEPVYLPIEKGVVSREHIDSAKGRDERMEAFISRAGEQYEVGLSYTENLKRFFEANPRTRRAIREKVWVAVEGGE